MRKLQMMTNEKSKEERLQIEPLLKVDDVAERLNISKTSAYRLMRYEIPCVRLGVGIVRVREIDLEAYVESKLKQWEGPNT